MLFLKKAEERTLSLVFITLFYVKVICMLNYNYKIKCYKDLKRKL
jgi:hypothetical protein